MTCKTYELFDKDCDYLAGKPYMVGDKDIYKNEKGELVIDDRKFHKFEALDLIDFIKEVII